MFLYEICYISSQFALPSALAYRCEFLIFFSEGRKAPLISVYPDMVRIE